LAFSTWKEFTDQKRSCVNLLRAGCRKKWSDGRDCENYQNSFQMCDSSGGERCNRVSGMRLRCDKNSINWNGTYWRQKILI